MARTTILVVDDEPLIRWSIGERLRAEGYDVLEAPDGRTAVDLFERGVDIVLLDSKLPDLNGIAVLAQLLDRDPSARVILMTADAGLESAAEALRHSGFPRASKPFLLDEIVALVKRTASEIFPQTGGKLRTA
jgi:two-component system KDP operon response regulator KdpE